MACSWVFLMHHANGASSSWIQAQDANNNATNYPLLLNPNGGNVGVNVTNPSTSLHVAGSLTLEEASATGNAMDLL